MCLCDEMWFRDKLESGGYREDDDNIWQVFSTFKMFKKKPNACH